MELIALLAIVAIAGPVVVVGYLCLGEWLATRRQNINND